MLLHIPKPNLRRSTISFSASKHLHYLAIGIMEQKTHIISAFQARIEFAEEIIAFCLLFFEVAVSLFQLSVIYKMFWANYGNLLLCFSLNGQHLLDAILLKISCLIYTKIAVFLGLDTGLYQELAVSPEPKLHCLCTQMHNVHFTDKNWYIKKSMDLNPELYSSLSRWQKHLFWTHFFMVFN